MSRTAVAFAAGSLAAAVLVGVGLAVLGVPARFASPPGAVETTPAPDGRRRRSPWIDRAFLLVGLALLVYVVSRYPLAEIVRACQRLGPWVALTPLLALGWFCCNTSALHLLLDRRVPWLRLFRIRLISDGYNALLPLAGLGGEPFRVKHLSEYVPTDHVLAAVIRDRVLENAVGMVLTSVWLAIAVGHFGLKGPFLVVVVGYAAFAAVVGVTVILLAATALPSRVGNVLARRLGVTSPGVVRCPPAKLIPVLGCYLAARVIGTLETALLLWLLGLGFDPLTILFCYSVHHMMGNIGFMFPQGVGVFEGTSVYLFSVLGFPGPLAVAFALARRGRMLLMGLIGVLLHVVGLTRPASGNAG